MRSSRSASARRRFRPGARGRDTAGLAGIGPATARGEIMDRSINRFLVVGGASSAVAALLHLGCIVFGAPWYRALGAGEHMAQMAAAGHPYPALVTLAIAAILAAWALYAFSGAGAIRRLPLARWVLCGIAGVYLARGVAFAPLMAHFPGNSLGFWLASSGICLALGIVHLVGLRQVWARLRDGTSGPDAPQAWR